MQIATVGNQTLAVLYILCPAPAKTKIECCFHCRGNSLCLFANIIMCKNVQKCAFVCASFVLFSVCRCVFVGNKRNLLVITEQNL